MNIPQIDATQERRWLLIKGALCTLLLVLSSAGIWYHLNARREFLGTGEYPSWRQLVEYYPHVLLYPALFALPTALLLSGTLILAYGRYSLRRATAFAFIFLISIIVAGVFTFADATADRMLLVEFAPQSPNAQLYAHFDQVMQAYNQGTPSNDVIEQFGILSNKLFKYENTELHRQYSATRDLYLWTIFSVSFLLSTLTLLIIVAALRRSELRPAEYFTLPLATLFLLCWIPFRITFNETTKFKLFPEAEAINNPAIGHDDIALLVVLVGVLTPLLLKLAGKLGLLKDPANVISKVSSFLAAGALAGLVTTLVEIFRKVFLAQGTDRSWMLWFCAFLIIGAGSLIAALANYDEADNDLKT